MVVSTSGDIGDVIFLMGVLKELPNGPHKILLQHDNDTKYKTAESIYKLESAVKDLAESQDYIDECRVIQPGDNVDWVSQEFRKISYVPGNTLLDAVVGHLNIRKGLGKGIKGEKSWLDIEPSEESKDRIVISRSGRWRNHSFPWAEVVKRYRWRLMFVGLDHEWREFIGHFGYVEFFPTSNMLQVAQIIKGSRLLICNQSSPNAIGEGLKHNMIQETSLNCPDCIFKRSNVNHVYNATFTLPGFDGEEDFDVTPKREAIKRSTFLTAKAPPGAWQYPNPSEPRMPITHTDFDVCVTRMAQLPSLKGTSKEDRETLLMEYTIDRIPDWGKSKVTTGTIRIALANAGYV